MNSDQHKAFLNDLGGVVDGSIKLDRKAQKHVEHCRECQLELGRYRSLLGSLQGLRTQVLEPAPGLLADILTSVSERAERKSIKGIITGRRVAYASGIAVAAAAGITGAVLLGRQGVRKAA